MSRRWRINDTAHCQSLFYWVSLIQPLNHSLRRKKRERDITSKCPPVSHARNSNEQNTEYAAAEQTSSPTSYAKRGDHGPDLRDSSESVQLALLHYPTCARVWKGRVTKFAPQERQNKRRLEPSNESFAVAIKACSS